MSDAVTAQASKDEPLAAIVTTDLAAITRGRFVAAKNLERIASTGIGWLPANISLTAFNSIAAQNPWGARGDLRVLPDLGARYHTGATGSPTAFEMVIGDIVQLDGTPWSCCTRTQLRDALADLQALAGVSLLASFEHEFQIFGAQSAAAHSLSLEALRRLDPFAPRLMGALEQAGVDPEVVIAEFGANQFEVTCAPATAVTAADRSIAIREITREVARNAGWRASFAPKTSPAGVGNGVHVHFSFRNAGGKPATYAAGGPGGLSAVAGAFCAGILRHLPGMTALTAPSVPSYFRLKPHNWSASYTWLGLQHREATLRICPVVRIPGSDPASQYNIEFRATDATANPYLVMTALVRAGIEGIRAKLPTPPLVAEDPTLMSETQRTELGLHRLPESLESALAALAADPTVNGWFEPVFLESFHGVRQAEMALLSQMDPAAICEQYRSLY
jgi:glutamine synthetase